jgi:hypothetical protein
MVVFFWLEFVAGRFCFVFSSCSMYFVCSVVVGVMAVLGSELSFASI